MFPSPNEYLHHILDETEYLMAQRQGLIEGRFLADATRRRAFSRSPQLIAQGGNKFGPAGQVEVAVNVKQVGAHGVRDLLRTDHHVGVGHLFIFKLVQRLRPGTALVTGKVPITLGSQPEQ